METINFEERFQEYVDSEQKVEPKHWMPEPFRKTLIRQFSQHAHSEVVGMLPEANWMVVLLTQAQELCSRFRTRPVTVCTSTALQKHLEQIVPIWSVVLERKAVSSTNYPTRSWLIWRHRLAGHGAVLRIRSCFAAHPTNPMRAPWFGFARGKLPSASGIRNHALLVQGNEGAKGNGSGRSTAGGGHP